MKALIQTLQILPDILALIKAIEQAVPKSGVGAAKRDAVIGIVEAVVGPSDGSVVGFLPKVIDVIVTLFNRTGEFEQAAKPVA